MDLRVDEVSDDDAIMRVNERERVVGPRAGSGIEKGSTVLVAVRPERMELRRGDTDVDADGGSRITGTVAQVVYLGTLTSSTSTRRSGSV